MRKHDSIDLMKLYSQGDNKSWNRMLTRCYESKDINALGMMRYQLQAGMDDLAKKKLNDDKMNLWYIRLLRSIEQTAKKIIRIKHPLPGDNPLIAKKHFDYLEQKRKRDAELKAFMEKSSY